MKRLFFLFAGLILMIATTTAADIEDFKNTYNPRDPNALSAPEYEFLVNLAAKLTDPDRAARVELITERLVASPKLTREDRDFLRTLAREIDNREIARELGDLIARHR